MKWELEALKQLSKSQNVPGLALADAIEEIEKLRKKLLLKNDAYSRLNDDYTDVANINVALKIELATSKQRQETASHNVGHYSSLSLKLENELDIEKSENEQLREALDRFAKIDLTQPIDPKIVYDILNARGVLRTK